MSRLFEVWITEQDDLSRVVVLVEREQDEDSWRIIGTLTPTVARTLGKRLTHQALACEQEWYVDTLAREMFNGLDGLLGGDAA